MSAARDALADRLAVTLVIDPLRTGYKFAEMLLALGLHPPLSPPSMFAGQLGAMVGALAGTVSAVEDCGDRSEEHTSELQSLMRISYAVFCLKKKIKQKYILYTLSRMAKHTNT